jgi:hypothetical protein
MPAEEARRVPPDRDAGATVLGWSGRKFLPAVTGNSDRLCVAFRPKTGPERAMTAGTGVEGSRVVMANPAEDRVYRIGISGSYGGMNLGDEAILDGMLSQLRATVPADITVFSRNPSDTLARHNIEHAVPVRSLTRREITP